MTLIPSPTGPENVMAYVRKKPAMAKTRKGAKGKAAAAAALPPVIRPNPSPTSLAVLALRYGDCRYPEGQGDFVSFCCNPTDVGSSYCTMHRALCCSGLVFVGGNTRRLGVSIRGAR